MLPDREMQAVSARIESLVGELETLEDVAVRGRVEELVRLLMQLHGEGLARMLAVLQDPAFEAGQAAERFSADPVVASVLMLHDLHPHDLRTRVDRALEILRSSLGSQVHLIPLAIDDEMVRVRIEVSPGGCGAPIERIRTTVALAIRDAAPDVREVEIEAALRPVEPSLIQLTRR